jgi:tellurium resistance protein TerZ
MASNKSDVLPLTGGRYGVAISWDKGHTPTDVDLQCVVVDIEGSIIDAVYFNNLKAMKCITHSGDELNGEEVGYDEIIWAGLSRLPEKVTMLIFVVATHTGHLRDVKNGHIHIMEETKSNEVFKFAMEPSEEEVDMVAAMIKSDTGEWKMQVIEEPAQDGRHFIDILEPTIGNYIRKMIPGAPRRQKVAFAMEKGAVFDLPQASKLSKVSACLGWDCTDDGVDLDVSAVLFDGNGKQVEAVFFSNLAAAGLTHSGDNLTGEGPGDDERIACNLTEIPVAVHQIVFVVNIYTQGTTFEKVANAYCRIVDGNETELARYQLTEGQKQNGLIIARLVRQVDGRFSFQAIGTFARGNTYKDSIPEMLEIVRQDVATLQKASAPPDSSFSGGYR